ncbi:MAG: prepilin peptidase [Pseudomonadales bacterium]|nr:prepilin peptidase [Pseudomonadales bacterium]
MLATVLSQSPTLFIGVCVVLGLLIGSFLNVVIYRTPKMLEAEWRRQCEELAGREIAADAAKFNLVTPRSACPACNKPITALQNIPVVSWLWLRGKCAACGTRISARYPLVELLTGVAFGIVAWKFGYGWTAAAALVFTAFLIALTGIDIDTQLLPDNLTLPLLWLGLLASLFYPVWAQGAAPLEPRASIIGAVSGYLSLWSVYHVFRLITGKEGMGYGDFKLFAAFGAWFGWQMLLPIIILASAVGAIVGVVMLARQGKDRSTPIAFGPFLAVAGWLALLVGHDVSRYLGLFGPVR